TSQHLGGVEMGKLLRSEPAPCFDPIRDGTPRNFVYALWHWLQPFVSSLLHF
ncbi:hypothetical protein BDN70DRAFT_879290, partial [Pholiota conissans]